MQIASGGRKGVIWKGTSKENENCNIIGTDARLSMENGAMSRESGPLQGCIKVVD